MVLESHKKGSVLAAGIQIMLSVLLVPKLHIRGRKKIPRLISFFLLLFFPSLPVIHYILAARVQVKQAESQLQREQLNMDFSIPGMCSS